jgi:hypothetical protein
MPTQSMVPMQIRPLPVSSGRQTPSTRLLDEHNKNLTMLATQSKADQKFDPPPAKRPTDSKFVEKFLAAPTAPLTTTLFVIGTLLAVYGALAK